MSFERFARQVMMPEIGHVGQARLAASRVAVVGLGGVGGPAALYLAAAGVGCLRVIDPDVASLDNLNRQILYERADVDQPKAERGARRLAALGPETEIEPLAERLDEDSAERLLSGVDLVVDGLDSFSARRVAALAASRLGLPFVHAAVRGWRGQVAVFLPGRGACFNCLFPRNPPPRDEPTPIIGVTAGIAGTLAAAEAVKCLLRLERGRLLAGRLLLFDLSGVSGPSFEVLDAAPNPRCPHPV